VVIAGCVLPAPRVTCTLFNHCQVIEVIAPIMITPIISRLVIHSQSLDGLEFRGGYKILLAEVLVTERISDEVINDFFPIIIFPY
jgi:hypothetical protein